MKKNIIIFIIIVLCTILINCNDEYEDTAPTQQEITKSEDALVALLKSLKIVEAKPEQEKREIPELVWTKGDKHSELASGIDGSPKGIKSGASGFIESSALLTSRLNTKIRKLSLKVKDPQKLPKFQDKQFNANQDKTAQRYLDMHANLIHLKHAIGDDEIQFLKDVKTKTIAIDSPAKILYMKLVCQRIWRSFAFDQEMDLIHMWEQQQDEPAYGEYNKGDHVFNQGFNKVKKEFSMDCSKWTDCATKPLSNAWAQPPVDYNKVYYSKALDLLREVITSASQGKLTKGEAQEMIWMAVDLLYVGSFDITSYYRMVRWPNSAIHEASKEQMLAILNQWVSQIDDVAKEIIRKIYG